MNDPATLESILGLIMSIIFGAIIGLEREITTSLLD
jgi:uncharacterized membrane protein YhiD involved in acid resistance